ncbi:MAG: COG4315 family predicted lipoprotein [Nocardioides sp.]
MRVAALVTLLVLVSGCGGTTPEREPESRASGPASMSESPTPSSTPSKRPTAVPKRAGTRIVIDDSAYGPMLFDARGQAIYLFDVEQTSRPRCYGECAVAWPPVLTKGDPVPGPGVQRNLLGTTERRDGSTQVTYGGHPLYFYVNEGPGEVECHDVFLNGGFWYVVQPDGQRAP